MRGQIEVLLKIFPELADETRIGDFDQLLAIKKGMVMIRKGLKTIVVLAIGAATHYSCGAPTAPTSTTNYGTTGPAGEQDPGATDSVKTPGKTTSGTGTGSNVPTAAQLAKSSEFFLNKVQPLFKGLPCSDCHNAPRNLKDPKVDGGTGILEHNKMFAFLKDGKGANDNKLINKLLGTIVHTGGKQCKDEAAQPCATIKEWYKTVFGDGVLSLGKIEGVNREGVIAGWAGNIDATTTAYEIKLFLDGDKATGVALPNTMANLDAYDNGLSGPHAFSVKLPPALIDGKPHKIWAYTTHNGTEVMLAGSPFSFQAFKPKGSSTNFNAIGFNGCNGACHTFTYETRWGTMLGNGMDGSWTATSNAAYDKISGRLGHGGPGLPGGLSVAALQAWFTEEFGTPVANP